MDEKGLIKEAKLGSDEAFKELLVQNHALVYHHVLSIVKNDEVANDLTEQTFVHAFQHINSFRVQAKFSTWLWRIAHNICLNYLKNKRQNDFQFNEEIASFVQEKEGEGELKERILKAAELLPQKQRTVFEMYYIHNIAQKQIAVQLKINNGTVRSRLFYARKKIRQLLREA